MGLIRNRKWGQNSEVVPIAAESESLHSRVWKCRLSSCIELKLDVPALHRAAPCDSWLRLIRTHSLQSSLVCVATHGTVSFTVPQAPRVWYQLLSQLPPLMCAEWGCRFVQTFKACDLKIPASGPQHYAEPQKNRILE